MTWHQNHADNGSHTGVFYGDFWLNRKLGFDYHDPATRLPAQHGIIMPHLLLTRPRKQALRCEIFLRPKKMVTSLSFTAGQVMDITRRPANSYFTTLCCEGKCGKSWTA
ncbi:MAG: hypothetical protein CM1200mP30_01360 [Pseudomonadota bacterium]|nr:MAG: hypothetical protein CM1200mP30_01360 [Pseudomonadota bacterium]